MMPQELLIKRVLELYGKYGIKVFTMDDIARACGISKKTLYSNFENKYELVEATVAKLTAQLMAEYNQLQTVADNAILEVFYSLDTVERLFKSVNYAMLVELEKYYYEIWRKVESFKQETGITVILKNIRRGQQEGLYHDSFDTDIIAKMRICQLESIHRYAHTTYDLHKTLYEISLHYLSGLATVKGHSAIKKYQTTQIQ